MQATVTFDLLRTFSPLRLAGPIFDKELRIASRRRRTYLLRFAYVAFLTLFVVQVLSVATRVPGAGSAVVRMSQMGLVASGVVSTIVWFQFLLAQLLAIVLLSGAIGNEVRQRSLDALLVTPISSLQIVVGKLLSGLLQLVLLLAVSLPLLATVRVFGGVPWGYVVFSLCTTLAAALFAGSLSLLLSVTNRHAYRVVSNAVGWCLVLWGGSAALLALLRWVGHIGTATAELALYLSNPFFVMLVRTQSMITAAPARWSTLGLWSVHCLVLLTGAVLMLLLAVRRIRRVALAPVPGQGPAASAQATTASLWRGWPRRRAVRRVTGSPIVWKELHRPFFARGRRGVLNALGLIAAGCLVVGALVFSLATARLPLGPVCIVLAVLLQLLFIINVATSAASAITREKEARTLPILLMAPLDNRAIIRGKALGLLRRNLPFLVPVPFLGVLAYTMMASRLTSSSAVLTVALLEAVALSDVVFLLGLGLCLSVYLKTTTPAVVATFILYVASKFFIRVLGGLFLLGVTRAGRVDTALFGVIATGVYVVVYSGLGVLLGFVAAAGLRRSSM